MKRTKQKARLHRLNTKPIHENLPWPGLKAEDHLSRAVTRAVKEAKETRETEAWAEAQIARVMDHIPPETAVRLMFCEMKRREKCSP